MTRQTHLMPIILCFTAFCCRPAYADCWPELQEKNTSFYNIVLSDDTDIVEMEAARAELRAALRKCTPSETFAKDLTNVDLGLDSYLTLLDFAVMADDVEMTAALLERQSAESELAISPERLEYGGAHLENAALVESGSVVRWLLEQGFDPNKAGESGATPLFFTQVRTESGLRATRDLMAYGANIEMRARFNLTPMMFARVNGDLRKVQCLLALGAQVPGEDEYVAVRIDDSKAEKIMIVDDFLRSSEREIPKQIMDICSID
jgi:hypothetical protein